MLVGPHFTAQASSMVRNKRSEKRGSRQEQPNIPPSRNRQSHNLYDSLHEVESPIGESVYLEHLTEPQLAFRSYSLALFTHLLLVRLLLFPH